MDAQVRVQSVPQYGAKETKESNQGENEGNDYQGEDEGVHDFRFLALWWCLYLGKSRGQVILYSAIRGWAFPKFHSVPRYPLLQSIPSI